MTFACPYFFRRRSSGFHFFIAALVLSSTWVVGARAETDPRAKPLFERYSGAVVRFEAVCELLISAQVGGEEKSSPSRDITVHGMATWVDPEGVLVAALSDFDASSAMDGKTVRGPKGQTAKLEVSVGDIKDLRFILADGSEISGEIVLKDEAVDLVVLRTKAGAWTSAEAGTRVPVDLAVAAEPELLDEVMVVGMSGESLGYSPVVFITGIIAKPTRSPLVYRPAAVQKGCPAFLLDGRFVGIGAKLVYRGKLVRESVLVPAAEVAALVKQAMERP